MKTRNIILIICILANSISYSQIDSLFKYDINGLNSDYVVIDYKDLSQSTLYNKTLSWVKNTFKNPDKVIKMKEENQSIRIQIFDNKSICGKYGCADELYTVQFEFRNDKIKVTPLEILGLHDSYKLDLKKGDLYYKSNGNIRKFYSHVPKGVEKLINSYNVSLNNFITSEEDTEW